MNFLKVYESIKNTGGATYNFLNGHLNPEDGYMVSFNGYNFSSDVPTDQESFQEALRQYFKRPEVLDKYLDTKHAYLGFWVHENKLHFDISIKVPTFVAAYVKATQENQIAFWGCAEQKAFFTLVNSKL